MAKKNFINKNQIKSLSSTSMSYTTKKKTLELQKLKQKEWGKKINNPRIQIQNKKQGTKIKKGKN
jgi:hypothetical protein